MSAHPHAVELIGRRKPTAGRTVPTPKRRETAAVAANGTAAAVAELPPRSGDVLRSADRAALAGLQEALRSARDADDQRPPFAIIADCLVELGVELPHAPGGSVSLLDAREEWLRRLGSANRSESTLAAYRIALDDLIGFLERSGRSASPFREETIVAYLDDYRRRRRPAEATYYRRFTLLRRFFRWLSRRYGAPDPFLELEAPGKPQTEADWLTQQEFARLLLAAGSPRRRRAGLAERDQLVLRALVATGLRRSELLALNWGDLDLDSGRPSLLVRRGKGGKPRRQPLPSLLAEELARLRATINPAADAPVFCGLGGRRLQPTVLATIIRRAATRAGLEKRVTAHTLRHTAATWLRQASGDARLVARYLGHADLSTVSRYAHVADDDLHRAAEAIASRLDAGLRASAEAGSVARAERSDAGAARGDGRAPAPSGTKETAERLSDRNRNESPAKGPIENPRICGGFP